MFFTFVFFVACCMWFCMHQCVFLAPYCHCLLCKEEKASMFVIFIIIIIIFKWTSSQPPPPPKVFSYYNLMWLFAPTLNLSSLTTMSLSCFFPCCCLLCAVYARWCVPFFIIVIVCCVGRRRMNTNAYCDCMQVMNVPLAFFHCCLLGKEDKQQQ